MASTERLQASETEEEAPLESALDPHPCEYCGEVLPDPGLAFLEHLEASERCYWLWRQYLPYIKEDAGAD
ncbi:MAG: hypothetical protein R3185_07175 [Candidatus Thermoplasmatota archaeon]|nr:hypothetical protein [Candidatus Thermoplasmatota archaeon]